MRRTRVALIVDLIWLAAVAAAGLAIWWLGPGWVSLPLAALFLLAAFWGSLAYASRCERMVQLKLAELGRAVGAGGTKEARNGTTVEAIVANLAGRLERASQFKTAFLGLSQPALVASSDGEILGVSRGLAAKARSNCILANTRLGELGIAMRPIDVALRDTMTQYARHARGAV